MSAALPLLKDSDLFQQINVILHKHKYIDEKSFDFRRLYKEIDALYRKDPSVGHALFGYLYHISGNVEYVRHHFLEASKYQHNAGLDHNYAIALLNLGLFEEAQKLYRNFGDPEHGLFVKSFEMGQGSFAFASQIEFAEKAEKMKLEYDKSSLSLIHKIESIFQDNNISDDDVASHAGLVGEVFRENQIFYKFTLPEIFIDDEDEDHPTVSFTYKVDVSAREAVGMYGDLIKRTAQRFNGMLPGVHFSISAA